MHIFLHNFQSLSVAIATFQQPHSFTRNSPQAESHRSFEAESLSRITQRRFASRSALKHQSRVPGVGHTAARGHLDEAAIGIKFEHRLRFGGADFSELGRGEAERAGQGEHWSPAGLAISGQRVWEAGVLGQTDHTETDIVVVDDGFIVAAAGRAAFAGVADPGAAAQQLLFVSSRSSNQPGLVITRGDTSAPSGSACRRHRGRPGLGTNRSPYASATWPGWTPRPSSSLRGGERRFDR